MYFFAFCVIVCLLLFVCSLCACESSVGLCVSCVFVCFYDFEFFLNILYFLFVFFFWCFCVICHCVFCTIRVFVCSL